MSASSPSSPPSERPEAARAFSIPGQPKVRKNRRRQTEPCWKNLAIFLVTEHSWRSNARSYRRFCPHCANRVRVTPGEKCPKYLKSWDKDWGALESEDSRRESQSTGSLDCGTASESFASQRRKATPRTLPQAQSPLPKRLEL